MDGGPGGEATAVDGRRGARRLGAARRRGRHVDRPSPRWNVRPVAVRRVDAQPRHAEGALQAPGAQDSPTAVHSYDWATGALAGRDRDSRPELSLVTEAGVCVVGSGRPSRTLHASRFELLRAMTGRRSEAQVRCVRVGGRAGPGAPLARTVLPPPGTRPRRVAPVSKHRPGVGCRSIRCHDVAWPRTLAPLRHRRYAALWTGTFTSNVGTWMETVGVAVLVTTRTGQAGWTGLVAAAGFLPNALVGPLGGALADRIPRRRLLLATTTVQTILAGTLTAMAATNTAVPWAVTLIVFASGSRGHLGSRRIRHSCRTWCPERTSRARSRSVPRNGTSGG